MSKDEKGWRMFWGFLDLVDGPVTSRQAYAFHSLRRIEKRWRKSDIYMIGARPDATFSDSSYCSDTMVLTLIPCVGEKRLSPAFLDLVTLLKIPANDRDKYWLAVEPHSAVFFRGPRGDFKRSRDLAWIGVDRLSWLRSHDLPGITGFDDYREAAVYDLLYVGIAKKGDTFERLIRRGHKARMDILSNEHQRHAGAAISDEIILFMFEVDAAILTKLVGDIQEKDTKKILNSKIPVIDAEKAFVKLLDPKYNNIKYISYPESKDGLFGSNLLSSAFIIRENISFQTPNGIFRGGRKIGTAMDIGDAQSILVTGSEVRIVDDLSKALLDLP